MDINTEQTVNKIENFLKEDDKISLIFLLVDDAEAALNHANSQTPLRDWCNVAHVPKLFNKLQEALSIVGCHKMLTMSKQVADVHFLPTTPETSLNICLIRKNLYLMCENLSKEECNELINLMEPETDVKKSNRYLELYLLEWLRSGKIAKDNMDSLSEALENIKKKKLALTISKIAEENKVKKQPSSIKIKTNTYDTDNGKGFCIIINQKEFHDPAESGGALRAPLETRIGTDVDRDRLTETFKMFNMDVEIWENYTKNKLMTSLSKVCKDFSSKHSMLIICVLSHGEKDIVYCSDYTTIPITDLKKLFFGQFCPALIGKPKLFIIQACKGNYAQIAVNQPPNPEPVPAHKQTVASDSPGTSQAWLPDQADYVTFHSTVPGYVSFRDLLHGTWFIDAFCSALLFETQNKGMLEVFADINRIASEKQIMLNNRMCAIMPVFDTTLRGNFKLNFHSKGVVEASVLCMERTLFRCLLDEYVENYSPKK